MRYLFFAALILLCTCVRGQIPASPAFSAIMDSIGVTIIQPLSGDFQIRPNQKNDYLDDQLTVYSKKEKLEIRFSLRAVPPNDIYNRMPNFLAGTLALNLGSNDEDAVTSVHSFGEEELAVFNADWAVMYTFRPKRSYSERTNAQLIAIYREGVGMAYTVLLFEKTPPTIEDRQLSLSFSQR
jgi:hypothetical protein